MKKWLFLVFLITGVSTPLRHTVASPAGEVPPLSIPYYLAFAITPGPNTSFVTFAMLSTSYDSLTTNIVGFMAPHEFLMQAIGIQQSKANPFHEDLFARYGIEGCKAHSAEKSNSRFVICPVVEQLWKLRYAIYPAEREYSEGGGGWSPGELPSEGQMRMLQEFGVDDIRDYFYGDNAFRLLKAMQDPAWVDEYKSLRNNY